MLLAPRGSRRRRRRSHPGPPPKQSRPLRFVVLCIVVVALAQARCAPEGADSRLRPRDPEMLQRAVSDLTRVMVFDIFSPPQASRVYAYASIAAYETARGGDPTYRSLANQLNGLSPAPAPDPRLEYHYPLAAAHAYLAVGRELTFSRARADSLVASLHASARRLGVPRRVLERSVAYGDAVARHVLAWAALDSFPQSRGWAKYSTDGTPGRWAPTPPAYLDAVEPNWGRLRPFALDSADQFRPAPPLPFDMAEGSPFRRQVLAVMDARRRLTEEQAAIAAFWDCNPYAMRVQGHTMYAAKKITPGGHWMEIVGIAARAAEADLQRSAEAYARTAVALADAFISTWREKYRSELVRPETVIVDHLEEGWQPLLQTPPFPEYPSGHSVVSTAAATVLTELFGEGFAFEDDSERDYGLPTRSFASFEQAAAEAAISRLYGGIHYPMAIEEGATLGRNVGRHVVARLSTRPAGVR